ncbi:MAG: YceI family protein [Flavobacteriales bacterium]
MNYSVLSAVALTATLLVACGPNEAEIAAAKEKATADSLAAVAAAEHAYTIDAEASKVKWAGSMIGIKSHDGTVKMTAGDLTVQGGMVTGGSFTIDMNSISPLDTNYAKDGAKQGTKAMLIGHLMSADFFDVANHPTASFKITSTEGNTATGELTVRGKTNTETVSDIVVTEGEGTVMATGKLTFDRQKYGVAFQMPMKDMVISDSIELSVELNGTAK